MVAFTVADRLLRVLFIAAGYLLGGVAGFMVRFPRLAAVAVVAGVLAAVVP